MKPRFEGLALCRVGKDLGGEATALRRIGNQLMDDVIGVNRRDAKFVQITRKEGLAAGNPPRQTDLHGERAG